MKIRIVLLLLLAHFQLFAEESDQLVLAPAAITAGENFLKTKKIDTASHFASKVEYETIVVRKTLSYRWKILFTPKPGTIMKTHSIFGYLVYVSPDLSVYSEKE